MDLPKESPYYHSVAKYLKLLRCHYTQSMEGTDLKFDEQVRELQELEEKSLQKARCHDIAEGYRRCTSE